MDKSIEKYKARRDARLKKRLDEFEENDHPRDENGRFTSGGGGRMKSGPNRAIPAKNLPPKEDTPLRNGVRDVKPKKEGAGKVARRKSGRKATHTPEEFGLYRNSAGEVVGTGGAKFTDKIYDKLYKEVQGHPVARERYEHYTRRYGKRPSEAVVEALQDAGYFGKETRANRVKPATETSWEEGKMKAPPAEAKKDFVEPKMSINDILKRAGVESGKK